MTELLATAARWIQLDPDPATATELQELVDDSAENQVAYAALERLFAGRLAFGTAGLRAELGPGPLRMNRLVVRQTAVGLLRYAAEKLRDAQASGTHSIVIGYDARHQSDEFAFDTAEIFNAAGWQVHLFDQPGPTPLLARQVLVQDAEVGVMVTASHNPPLDNGYKVYFGGELSRFLEPDGLGVGAQIISPFDQQIAATIAELVDADFDAGSTTAAAESDAAAARAPSGVQPIGADARQDYQREALQLLDVESYPHRDLTVVYTAMHGVGGEAVTSLLEAAGFDRVIPVAQQFAPDPDFPTADFPNPEEPGALDLALQAAAEHRADLVLANDPDADRLSAAVYDEDAGRWRQLSGDEMGALLGAHIITRGPLRPGWQTTQATSSPVIGNSVVSSRLLGKLCAARGIGHEETLTGFKWLARVPNMTFGYEEAIGFDVDPVYIRDKDGIGAALIFCELMADLKARGKNAVTALDEIAAEAGVHLTGQLTIRVDDITQLGHVTAQLRSAPPTQIAGAGVTETYDLISDPLAGQEFTESKSTDVLIFLTADDDRVIVRPSGTEPKVKCYLEAAAQPASAASSDVTAARQRAETRLTQLRTAMETILGTSMTTTPAPEDMAGIIDHTVLKPDTDESTVRRVIAEAVEHRLAAVCINPKWVALTAAELAGTSVKTCTVVGFPLGATTTAQKVAEAREAVDAGAQEIDMVVDIADANAGAAEAVTSQIAAVAAVTHSGGALLKVILETSLLEQAAKELVCRAAEDAGADFVKTSTGFAGGGATVADIELMHSVVGGRLGIKASGGVRSYQDALALVGAGATRIGASSSLDIVDPSNAGSAGSSSGNY